MRKTNILCRVIALLLFSLSDQNICCGCTCFTAFTYDRGTTSGRSTNHAYYSPLFSTARRLTHDERGRRTTFRQGRGFLPLLIPASKAINHLKGYNLQIATLTAVSSGAASTYNNIANGEKKRPDQDDRNVDALRARAGVLRRSILEQQIEVHQLEEQIVVCCSSDTSSSLTKNFDAAGKYIDNDRKSPFHMMSRAMNGTMTTFSKSTNVLLRELKKIENQEDRMQRGILEKKNKNYKRRNRKWKSVNEFVVTQTTTGIRIVTDLFKNPNRLVQLVDPTTPTLAAHLPAIISRLDKLEGHLPPILERVLNNQRHLTSIEPYLDQILERFDDIEPHLAWILDNVDTLAPYTGLLLKHIDELLLFAEDDADEGDEDASEESRIKQYKLANQLLPYLGFYVSRLDMVGPHLPLLRPHIPKLLKHDRIKKVTPYIDQLFAVTIDSQEANQALLRASANIDILLFWFGWSLRVPFLPRLFFAIPAVGKIVALLANRLPKRFARKGCVGVTCNADGDYGAEWNQL